MPLFSEFKIKIFSPGRFVYFDFTNETYLNNNTPFTADTHAVDELDYFVNTILKKHKQRSNIEDYLTALHAVQKIKR